MEGTRGSAAQGLLALAIGTAVATFFVWASLRAIAGGTTDPAREYVFLVLCGAWLLYAGLRLIRIGRRILGGVSLFALAAGALGERGMGPGTGFSHGLSSLSVIGALLWFLALTVVLAALSWRASRAGGRLPGS
jgi:hypothetical protein